jgi:hypothetical protein
MEPREVAKQIAALGAAWAKGRGLRREDGISAMVEAVAELGVEMFRGEDGRVWLKLPEGTDSRGKGH